ncbi:hypothetical protein Trydic_g13402 [Trypoxylus dichotomus]
MFFCVSCCYALLLLLVCLVLIKIFLRLTSGISKSNTCLVGKTVLITGGNSGLGFQTALALAGRGARIIIADKDDATESIRTIIEETNNNNLIYKYIDLSSLSSIRRFAKELNAEESRLDILINNAGVGSAMDKYTEDGLYLHMQVNHFGPFLLSHLLIDLLKKSSPSRIIFVSSLLAFLNNLTVENLNSYPKKGFYFCSQLLQYGNSKLMNAITANILGEKLRGSGVTTYSVHPGVVNTNIFTRFGGRNSFYLFKVFLYNMVLPVYGKTTWQGAQTQINCSLSKELENVTGKFYVDCKEFPPPWRSLSKDRLMELWTKTEELVKLGESEKL